MIYYHVQVPGRSSPIVIVADEDPINYDGILEFRNGGALIASFVVDNICGWWIGHYEGPRA